MHINFAVGMSSAVVILLPTKQLISFYILMSLFGTLYTSYFCNVMLVQSFMHPEISNCLSPFFLNFWIFVNKWTSLERHSSSILVLSLSQILLAKLYWHLKDDLLKADKWSYYEYKSNAGSYKIYFLFVFPVVLVSLSTNGPALNFAPIVEVVLAMVDMKPVFELLKVKFLEFQISLPLQLMLILRNEQLMDLAASHWISIKLSKVFQSFCILQSITTIVLYLNSSPDEKFDNKEKLLIELIQEILERSTRTYLSLVCLSSILSLVAHHIENLFRRWIGVETQEESWLSKSVPILFFILAVQTGLPVLLKNKRLTRLSYIFSLLFLSCLRHLHSLLHRRLLITALTPFSFVHLRHLLLDAIIISLTLSLINYQWHEHTFSVWSLSITVFGMDLIFKIIISLLIYGFTFTDTQTRFSGENADEYVYHIKFIGEIIEFLLGIFFFCNGAWMILFESAGLVRAVVMCAHLYFNIWCKAKQLYTACMKRKEALLKVSSLRSKTETEMQSIIDICAICYEDLQTGLVKETECKHLFHESCLCKWASVSDKCPMCHGNAFNQVAS